MSKNIVICCDGTGNEYGSAVSNVVRIYQVIDSAVRPSAYYHPGVGTMGATAALTTAGKNWTKWRGLAFGWGMSENIADAYRFLMRVYEPNDRVFLFGFSRGAYTVRALCGLLQMCGLLYPGNEGQIPYALRLFKRRDGRIVRRLNEGGKFKIARGFKKTFARPCRPHFLGVWDTVSSVGWILDPFGLKPGTLPYTYELEEVAVVRHAVSIDERRAFFRTNLCAELPGKDVKQVWFAGVHSDVGGGYREEEAGLSKITLQWMLQEAVAAGFPMDSAEAGRRLGGEPRFSPPSPSAQMHDSLTARWWLGEFWPKWTKRRVSGPDQPPRYRGRPRLNVFRRRFMPEHAVLHGSVATRMRERDDYRPTNLPKLYTFESDEQMR